MDGLDSRLAHFLLEWRRCQASRTEIARLTSFLDSVAPLLPRREARPKLAEIDVQRLKMLLSDLSMALHATRSNGGSLNAWAVAGLKRREVRNAAVLGSLWSPMQCGEVAIAFVTAFLLRIEHAGISFPEGTELSKGFAVRTEHSPGADGRDRVDLVIESTGHLIGIEVKIDAGEGPDQLARYIDSIRRNARSLGKSPAVILLARFAPSHPEVLSASWSDVRAAGLAILPPRQDEYTYAHHLIADFTRHVKTF